MTGRSQKTSVEAIEQVALELFAKRGFDQTPVEAIVAATGISRRSFFRYFGSKNDILFGGFGRLLSDLDEWFASAPNDRPMFEVIADATVGFNRLHSDGPIAHRQRMELILHTPALRANSVLRHDDWRAVVARYAARRTGEPPDTLGPQLAGHAALAASTAAYEEWLRDESSDLVELIHRAFAKVEALSDLDPQVMRRPLRSPRDG